MDGFVSNECVDRFRFFVLEMAAAAAIPVVPAEANCDAIAAGTATYCTCRQERDRPGALWPLQRFRTYRPIRLGECSYWKLLPEYTTCLGWVAAVDQTNNPTAESSVTKTN